MFYVSLLSDNVQPVSCQKELKLVEYGFIQPLHCHRVCKACFWPGVETCWSTLVPWVYSNAVIWKKIGGGH